VIGWEYEVERGHPVCCPLEIRLHLEVKPVDPVLAANFSRYIGVRVLYAQHHDRLARANARSRNRCRFSRYT